METSRLFWNRRRFLGVGAALAGGALLDLPTVAHAASALSPIGETLSPTAWRQLNRQLKGTLLRPGQTGFANLALPNNLRYRLIRPGGIALCADEDDIAICLRWARRHGVPLTTRGGGHSYAGYSCTEGLMVNLMQLNSARYNAAARTITLGGGIRNGPIYTALGSVNRAVTHGRCLSVGAAGFLLGGGVGFDMRHNGIGSDKLIRTEVVLASGDRVTASPNENPELFWACRGGAGGNFGINTSFTLETFPVDRATEFQIRWSDVSNEFLLTLFQNLENAPDTLGSKIILAPGLPLPGQSAPIDVEVIGQFVGAQSTLDEILAPITAVQTPASRVVQEMAYWNSSSYLSEAGSPAYYQERSRFINSPMTPLILDAVRDWLPRWPNAQGSGSIKFFQMGGAIRDMGPTESAFVHRAAHWLASIGTQWTPGQTEASRRRALRWQHDFYGVLTPLCEGGGAYQNFPDPNLQDWAEAYYGENLPRLQRIKETVDPDNLFRCRQSIRLPTA